MKMFFVLLSFLILSATEAQIIREGRTPHNPTRGTNHSDGTYQRPTREVPAPRSNPSTNHSSTQRPSACPRGLPCGNKNLDGGVHCKQCPAESANCLPKAGCEFIASCPESSEEQCSLSFVGSECVVQVTKTRGTCEKAPFRQGNFCQCR